MSRAEFVANEAYAERSLGWWAWKLGSLPRSRVGRSPPPLRKNTPTLRGTPRDTPQALQTPSRYPGLPLISPLIPTSFRLAQAIRSW